jgi:putative membrane protein
VSELAPEPRRLHPATLVVRWLKIVPQALVGVVAASASLARQGLGSVLIVVALAALVGAAFAFLIWWRFRYTVGTGEILIESGLLNRQRRIIPYDRVQDIAIERPLLARLFGTARVRIETGGSAADEGNLDMIAIADAEALRDHIRRGRAGTASSGAEAATPAPVEEPVLFSMDFGRLLFSGLFNFSLIFLAAIFAALQYLDDFGLIELEDWFTPERAGQAAAVVGVQATLMLIGLLLSLGIVAGVLRTVARDFGFRLTRSQGGLRRRRGLLTLTEVVIPIRRTQVAVIDSGPVARRLGWYRLSFQTLGADRKEGGVQVAAPFARLEEIGAILAEAGFAMPPPRGEFAHIPPRALWRWAGQYLLAGAAVAAAALAIEPRLGIAAGILLGLAVYAALRWRRHAYALGEEALFVTDGLLRRRVWTIPFGRAQTIMVGRGPLQRGLGLATLLVDTAGGSLFRGPEIVDLDSREAEALADRLLSLFYRARSGTGARR